MRKNWKLISLLIAAGLALCIEAVASKQTAEQEKEVSLEQVPEAVKATILAEAKGGTIDEIEMKTANGQTVYEVQVVVDGEKILELQIAEAGALLKKELKDPAQHKVWTFDKDKVGSVPNGWQAAETRSQSKLGKWEVIKDESAPSPPNVLSLTATKNTGSTFNLLIAKKTSFKDLQIGVRVKAMTGEEDQGGGPIWRAKDPNNYYIARWNPLEKNFRVYFVKDGRRKQLASSDTDTNSKVWHRIEIKHKGAKIEANLDGKKLIELEDSTFLEPGMVGLWTKADAATAFDSIKVEELADNKDNDKKAR